MDSTGRTPPFHVDAPPGVEPLSAVDCRATRATVTLAYPIDERVATRPGVELPMHAVRSHFRIVALVEAVARRLPITVIGALTHRT